MYNVHLYLEIQNLLIFLLFCSLFSILLTELIMNCLSGCLMFIYVGSQGGPASIDDNELQRALGGFYYILYL